MSSETDHATLTAAKKAGHSGIFDFKGSAQELFTMHGTRVLFK